MGNLVVILGTDHRLQGAEKRSGNIDDPDYRILVEQLVTKFSINFIFEEVTDLGPSLAEKFASERLGSDRYRDIDPARELRPSLGIPISTGESYWIGGPNLNSGHWGCAHEEFVDALAKREQIWLRVIKEEEFKAALAICGQVHGLSFGSVLGKEDFDVKLYHYLPFSLLAQR
jgi:hypothetical protein